MVKIVVHISKLNNQMITKGNDAERNIKQQLAVLLWVAIQFNEFPLSLISILSAALCSVITLY